MPNKKRIYHFIMASVIFIVAIIELITFIMSSIPIENYYEFWFPLASTTVILLFSIEKLIRSFLYKACVYTKVVVVAFTIIQIFNIVAYLTQCGLNWYTEYVYPILLITIFGIIGLKLNRFLFYKN